MTMIFREKPGERLLPTSYGHRFAVCCQIRPGSGKKETVMHGMAKASYVLAVAAWLLAGCSNARPAATPSPLHDESGPLTAQPRDLPTVRFYEGFDGTQENLCTVTIAEMPYWVEGNVKDFHCDNDEIRSMKLHKLPAGSYVTLYNDPHCGDHDDWQRTSIISSTQTSADIIVSGFTTTNDNMTGPGESPTIYALKYRKSGARHEASPRYELAGEVSCMNIYVPGP